MKQIVENEPHLDVKQLMIDELCVEQGQVTGVVDETGARFAAPCVILCTGTYLQGRIVFGSVNFASGPNGMRPATHLSASLLAQDIK